MLLLYIIHLICAIIFKENNKIMDITKNFAKNYVKLLSDDNTFSSFFDISEDTKDFSILSGICTITNLPCVLIVMNKDFKIGTMGYECGENITLSFEKAITYKLPVVCVTVSGGARVHDGVAALMQMAKNLCSCKKT